MDDRLKFNSMREGIIGNADVTRAEVLFILREPNDKDNQDKFWFKNDIYKTKKENKYYRTLCILASKLITGKESDYEKLGKCAYINLHPMSGKATVSESYKLMKKEHIYERLASCFEALKPKKIVCCMDIYDKIVKNFDVVDTGHGFGYENKRKFRKGKLIFGNESIEVFEFYHPKARYKFERDNIYIIKERCDMNYE